MCTNITNLTDVSFDDWLHSSDLERMAIRNRWNTLNDEGKETASKVASLFKSECIYNIGDTNVIRENNLWIINAYVSTDDYFALQGRSNIYFLGIEIKFLRRSSRSTTPAACK